MCPSIHPPIYLPQLIWDAVVGTAVYTPIPTQNKKKNQTFRQFIPVHSNKLRKAAEKNKEVCFGTILPPSGHNRNYWNRIESNCVTLHIWYGIRHRGGVAHEWCCTVFLTRARQNRIEWKYCINELWTKVEAGFNNTSLLLSIVCPVLFHKTWQRFT